MFNGYVQRPFPMGKCHGHMHPSPVQVQQLCNGRGRWLYSGASMFLLSRLQLPLKLKQLISVYRGRSPIYVAT